MMKSLQFTTKLQLKFEFIIRLENCFIKVGKYQLKNLKSMGLIFVRTNQKSGTKRQVVQTVFISLQLPPLNASSLTSHLLSSTECCYKDRRTRIPSYYSGLPEHTGNHSLNHSLNQTFNHSLFSIL